MLLNRHKDRRQTLVSKAEKPIEKPEEVKAEEPKAEKPKRTTKK